MAIDERELSDATLVSAAQDGDSEAFAALFRRHYPTVRRACVRRLGSQSDADEVAQAAFVRAYERLDQCGGDRRFGAWVQVIAFNLGVDTMRQHARLTPMDEPLTGDAALGPNHCEDHVLRKERAAEVSHILSSLPPRQREVLIARDMEGRGPGEIAASLGLSLGAVDSLLLRARRRLATIWTTTGPERGSATTQLTTTSLAATTVATSSAPIERLAAKVSNAIAQVSYHVAAQLGAVPGTPSALSRLATVGVAATMAVAPAAAVVSAPSVASSAPAAAPAPAVAPVALTVASAPSPAPRMSAKPVPRAPAHPLLVWQPDQSTAPPAPATTGGHRDDHDADDTGAAAHPIAYGVRSEVGFISQQTGAHAATGTTLVSTATAAATAVVTSAVTSVVSVTSQATLAVVNATDGATELLPAPVSTAADAVSQVVTAAVPAVASAATIAVPAVTGAVTSQAQSVISLVPAALAGAQP